MILTIVRTTMSAMCDAIDGNISMTPDIVDSINAVFDFRVPRKFQYDPTGAEISWLTASLAGWIKGLLDRHHQLNIWISKCERPPSFWLTGFFNPQGFLTAMKQEVTRQKKTWSLDEVEYTSDVLKEIIQGEDGRIEGKAINHPQEGIHIHGLFLEGADGTDLRRDWKSPSQRSSSISSQSCTCQLFQQQLTRTRLQAWDPRANKTWQTLPRRLTSARCTSTPRETTSISSSGPTSRQKLQVHHRILTRT